MRKLGMWVLIGMYLAGTTIRSLAKKVSDARANPQDLPKE